MSIVEFRMSAKLWQSWSCEMCDQLVSVFECEGICCIVVAHPLVPSYLPSGRLMWSKSWIRFRGALRWMVQLCLDQDSFAARVLVLTWCELKWNNIRRNFTCFRMPMFNAHGFGHIIHVAYQPAVDNCSLRILCGASHRAYLLNRGIRSWHLAGYEEELFIFRKAL